LKVTQLYEFHKEHAKLTEFAGYEMPVWYSSMIEEHMAVRTACGIFDVSHMGRVRVRGHDSGGFLDSLFPSAIASQPVGKSVYTLMLNDSAGILDDLIVMKLGEEDYIVVVNASNAAKDLAQIRGHTGGFDVSVSDETPESAMIAVQGPAAKGSLGPLTPLNLDELKRFRCASSTILGHACTISRTGYTGEDGFEVIVHGPTVEEPKSALESWAALAKTAKTCGLGARDSLRIEAGFPLYGNDIGPDTNPFEADLAWVIAKDKAGYVGQEKLSSLAASPPAIVRRGVVLDEKIPRSGFEVLDPERMRIGRVTSGTFSPVLKRGIALASVDQSRSDLGSEVFVTVRDADAGGRLVKPPFYDESRFGWKRQNNGK